MSFILYVVVLVVSVSSVMMGLDWLSTPPPPVPKSVQTVIAPAKPAAQVASAKTSAEKITSKQTASTTGKAGPSAVAKTDAVTSAPVKMDVPKTTAAVPAHSDVASAAPETAGSAPANAMDNRRANTADDKTTALVNVGDVSGATAQANATAPRCDVQACAQRYHTFSASDCTYQPFDGPRRLCTVGNPPSQADAVPAGVQTSDARQQPASSSCNYQACGAAYRSFDSATCTYQPFEGARRLCEK